MSHLIYVADVPGRTQSEIGGWGWMEEDPTAMSSMAAHSFWTTSGGRTRTQNFLAGKVFSHTSICIRVAQRRGH